MSNSEFLEELCWSAHSLGIFDKVWELTSEILTKEPSLQVVDALQKSLKIITEKGQN